MSSGNGAERGSGIVQVSFEDLPLEAVVDALVAAGRPVTLAIGRQDGKGGVLSPRRVAFGDAPLGMQLDRREGGGIYVLALSQEKGDSPMQAEQLGVRVGDTVLGIALSGEEERVDPVDSQPYPLRSFVEVYGGSLDQPPPEWEHAKHVHNAAATLQRSMRRRRQRESVQPEGPRPLTLCIDKCVGLLTTSGGFTCDRLPNCFVVARFLQVCPPPPAPPSPRAALAADS